MKTPYEILRGTERRQAPRDRLEDAIEFENAGTDDDKPAVVAAPWAP